MVYWKSDVIFYILMGYVSLFEVYFYCEFSTIMGGKFVKMLFGVNI